MGGADVDTVFEEALARHKAGDLASAEALYRKAWSLRPTATVLVNLGALYREQGRFDLAEKVLKYAAEQRPDLPYAAYNLGNLYWHLGRLAEAEAAQRAAIAVKPDYVEALANLGLILLARGEFTEGWPLFENRSHRINSAIRSAAAAGHTSFPEWRGEPLAGRSILVWLEQGMGDQIQAARYVTELRRMGASRIGLVCDPLLRRLFSQLPADDLYGMSEHVEFPNYDYWVLSLSLPGRLGFRSAQSYLRPLRTASPPPSSRLRVGTVWRGNPQHPNDVNRSMPGAELLASLGSERIELVDLQDARGDMADSASRVAELDLLVTVDTSWAHLAGALGKPVWILLPALGADWRWVRGETESRWYPSARLFWQDAAGDWREVVEHVRRALDSPDSR